jgi:hypothetical protein
MSDAPSDSPTRFSVQDVLGVAQRLPSTSHVFAQVNRLLDDPNTDLDAISELVKMDPVLSFRVLQLANSAIYGFRTACSDLSEALARLGFTEINRLVGLIATKNLCTSFLSVYGLSSEVFWDDSMRSALACEWLSQRHAYGDGRTAYTAGLLRSMGKVVIQRILVDRPVAWRSYVDASGGLPLLAWETEVFGLTNTEAAGVLMKSGNSPPSSCMPSRRTVSRRGRRHCPTCCDSAPRWRLSSMPRCPARRFTGLSTMRFATIWKSMMS